MDKQEEVSIEEKAKAVFEWAGLCVYKRYTTTTNIGKWVIEDSLKMIYDLPMPDDIKFLGYMDKYVFKKLQDDGWHITVENINWYMGERVKKWRCELWNGSELCDNKIDIEGIAGNEPTARLNAVYEMINGLNR